jgi:hypothetical protein
MRILSILLLLVASQSPAQKNDITNHLLYSITVSIDHISYPGNKKYRPKHTEYPRHSLHTGWGISAGVDMPFSKNSSNHFFQWSQSFRAGYLNNREFNMHSDCIEPTLSYKLSFENSQMLQTVYWAIWRVYPKGGMISKQQEKIYIDRKAEGNLPADYVGWRLSFSKWFCGITKPLAISFLVTGALHSQTCSPFTTPILFFLILFSSINI